MGDFFLTGSKKERMIYMYRDLLGTRFRSFKKGESHAQN